VFRYAAGTRHYLIRTEGVVELTTDTVSQRMPVSRTASYTLTLLPDTGGVLRMTGTVDSFSVSGDTAIPAPRQDSGAAAAAIAFSETMTPTGELASFQGQVADSCDSATSVLAAAAQELVIPLPPTLADSASWTDSTTVTTCRGGLPVTTIARHQYRVAGQTTYAGVPAIRLLRATSTELSGSGTPPNRTDGTFTLTGRGHSTATLYLDPLSGMFLGGISEGEADITVTAIRDQLPFHQRVRQEIVLQP
jgi:hypothetical protein